MTDTVVSLPGMRLVELDEGIKRGDQTLMKLHLRKPGGGELRGLSTVDVIRQDYSTMQKLIPRITVPPITEAEFAALDPADILTVGSEAAAFFLNRRAKEEAGLDA